MCIEVNSSKFSDFTYTFGDSLDSPSYERDSTRLKTGIQERTMEWKGKLALGILTAVAMMLLTFILPHNNAVQSAQLVQFPVTVGVWAIFVLLFVKLK